MNSTNLEVQQVKSDKPYCRKRPNTRYKTVWRSNAKQSLHTGANILEEPTAFIFRVAKDVFT
jgi:hypothetical protein